MKPTAPADRIKQLEKARTTCRTSLRAKPYDTECLHALGLIEIQLGNRPAAKQWFKKALNLKPNSPEIQSNYGLALIEDQEYAEALTVLRSAVTHAPDHVHATYHLALALSKTGQAEEATPLYQRVLSAKPNFVEALNSYGNLLFDQGKPLEAIQFYQRALTQRPTFVMGYNNLGLALAHLGKLEEAEAHYRKAIELMPTYPMAYNNLGIIHAQRDRFDESIACYEKALELRPDYAEAHNNLGNALKECGRLTEAATHYQAAIRLQNAPAYIHNLALVQLALGQFEQGWRGYETRWQTPSLSAAYRAFPQPQWQGEDAAGKVLMIHGEQGFGDTLQFCRFAPLARARGMKVIIEVQPALEKIVGTLDGVDQVIAQDQPLPDFDLHCPMLSLPLAFGTTMESIPAQTPYLRADTKASAAWVARLPNANGAKRIGLVWAGNARMHSQDLAAANRRRSLSPEQLAPLLSLSGAQFYSLQKQGEPAPASFNLIDFMAECDDFAATAALLDNMDLLITVDTAMAHLAGAMGKPVWLLNRFNGCWRWLQNREDSPWYPQLRQFRQPSLGNWTEVIERVRQELEAHLSEGKGF